MSTQPAADRDAPSLGELAREACRGRRALEALLLRCRPILHAIILDRVHNPEVAEDLTQEALADVSRALPKLRAPQAFPAWLRQIAINRCNLWWRRSDPEPEPLSEDYQRLVYEDTFTEAARRETWRELQRALDDLPEQSRVALLMHVLGGLSHNEIAEALGTTATSVGVRIHRARRRLRRSLQPLSPISEEEWQDAH